MAENGWRNRIVCDPQLRHGEPCIAGTRIAVSVIVASLADMDKDALLKQFPQLAIEDIQAALYYAAEASHATLVC
ncbi:MAG: DUF433 domain-containing protein [Planctomycetes bacterium]|nr:DUF433 domain-containing protein [Planctomycetota bacterium]